MIQLRMNKILFKIVLAILITFSLLTGCSKKNANPSFPDAVDNSKDPVELLASGKGFKKVYCYVESYMPYFHGTLNEIHGLDLTIEGTDKGNFAFSQSRGNQQGTIKRVLCGTANYTTKTVIAVPVAYTYISPSGSSWQDLDFSYAPYTNKLAYMYYKYNNKTKKLTKVFYGASLPVGAKSLDIDENGNLYYFVANSVYKQSAATGTSTVAADVLTNGYLSLLKYYSGKLFLLA